MPIKLQIDKGAHGKSSNQKWEESYHQMQSVTKLKSMEDIEKENKGKVDTKRQNQYT